jgi:hypothetical protein
MLTLEKWERIVGKAIEDAMDGDPIARGWVTKYVLGGDRPMSLTKLAAEEADGFDAAADVAAEMARARQREEYPDGSFDKHFVDALLRLRSQGVGDQIDL